jgi:uncharacterized protein (DUF433 family)
LIDNGQFHDLNEVVKAGVQTLLLESELKKKTTQSTEPVWFDHGKPMIANSRVPVAYALAAVLFKPRGLDDFLENYPWVTRAQAEAALAWACRLSYS